MESPFMNSNMQSDMEAVKRIPYGVSDFVAVVEQNQYYVDKTMYLPLLEQQPSNLFLPAVSERVFS